MTEDVPHILVVDDDARLRELLRRYLTDNGFRVTGATDARDAQAKIASLAFDAIVLDVMLPGESGFSFTARMRAEGSDVPILLLTARGDPEDRIAGLELGAEDYLAKPFEPRELVLRLRTVLRRRRTDNAAAGGIVRFGRFALDLDRDELTVEGRPVRLTTAEMSLLKLLAARAGETLSRDELARASGLEAGPRAIDVHVARLRRKIEADPKAPRHLHTVWGRGYLLKAG